jgi:hypothetical protein
LLWGAGAGEFLDDAQLSQVGHHDGGGEFPTLIRVKDMKLPATGAFSFGQKFLKTGKSFTFSM